MNSLGIWLIVLLAACELDSIEPPTENAMSVLNYTNIKRSEHGCPPLTYNGDLSLSCTKHAEEIARVKRVFLSENNNVNYTENLCTFGIKPEALSLCVEKWYHGSRFDMLELHAREFTAMIWRSSIYMAYGEAMISPTTAVMVVRFSPPGNVLGQYTFNVPPIEEGSTKKEFWSSDCAKLPSSFLNLFIILSVVGSFLN